MIIIIDEASAKLASFYYHGDSFKPQWRSVAGKASISEELQEKLYVALLGKLLDEMKEYPFQLSGGMRQRVMIAMALANHPDLLIADEPTTALDVTIQHQILKQMRSLQEEYGTSIIFITHDLGVVAELCDRVVVLYGGLVMEEAEINDLFENPLHPYTMGLLASIPGLTKDESERLQSIPGSPPDMTWNCREHKCSTCNDGR